jgi:hypothetical protein
MLKGTGFYDSIIIKLPMPIEFTKDTLQYSLMNKDKKTETSKEVKKTETPKVKNIKVKKVDITKEEEDVGKALMDIQDKYKTETDKESKKYLKQKYEDLKKQHLKNLGYAWNFNINGDYIEDKKKSVKEVLKKVVGPVKFAKPILKKNVNIGREEEVKKIEYDPNILFNKEWEEMTDAERKQRIREAGTGEKVKIKIKKDEPVKVINVTGDGIKKKRGRPKKSNITI